MFNFQCNTGTRNEMQNALGILMTVNIGKCLLVFYVM